MSVTTSPSTSTASAANHLHFATAVDEAFADLADLAIRVDEAQSSTTAGHYVAETERLVSRISQQLQAIEQQRHRLVELLRGLESPAQGEPTSVRN